MKPGSIWCAVYLVSIHKWSFCPISALCSKNNPRNITHMPAVIFLACLDIEQKSSFMDGHYLICLACTRSAYLWSDQAVKLPALTVRSSDVRQGFAAGSVPVNSNGLAKSLRPFLNLTELFLPSAKQSRRNSLVCLKRLVTASGFMSVFINKGP